MLKIKEWLEEKKEKDFLKFLDEDERKIYLDRQRAKNIFNLLIDTTKTIATFYKN